MALSGTTTFENGLDGWRALNLAQGVTVTRVSDGTAQSGNSFVRCRTTAASGSIAVEVPTRLTLSGAALVTSSSGGVSQGTATVSMTIPALSVTAVMRAKPGGPNVVAALTIWELNRPNDDNHPNFQFTVGSQWSSFTHVSAMRGQTGAARVEIYILTPNADLDIDQVSVT